MTNNTAPVLSVSDVLAFHPDATPARITSLCLTCGSITEATSPEQARMIAEHFVMTCCSCESTVLLPFQ